MSGDGFRTRIEANEFGSNRRARPRAVEHKPSAARVAEIERETLRAIVDKRLLEAGNILKRCPIPAEVRRLVGNICTMPDVIHDRSDHALWDGRPAGPVRPTAREISALEEAFDWILILDPEIRTVVVARMLGFSYAKIARTDTRRRSKTTLQRVYSTGITKILWYILDVAPDVEKKNGPNGPESA